MRRAAGGSGRQFDARAFVSQEGAPTAGRDFWAQADSTSWVRSVAGVGGPAAHGAITGGVLRWDELAEQLRCDTLERTLASFGQREETSNDEEERSRSTAQAFNAEDARVEGSGEQAGSEACAGSGPQAVGSQGLSRPSLVERMRASSTLVERRAVRILTDVAMVLHAEHR
jgi:hypothetical protein